MKYRKKPVVVEAKLWDGEWDEDTDSEWFAEARKSGKLWQASPREAAPLHIKTPEGVMQADFGDYIIRGIKGELYPCKPDIFEATYREVEKDDIDCGDLVFDWIDVSLAIGGVLTMSKCKGKVTASMNYRDREVVRSVPCDSCPEALNSLNHELREQAADDMIRVFGA